jgi:hypothetical protein
MQDASRKPASPNPIRTPLLLIAGLVAIYGYPFWVGGTGGLDPARFDPDLLGQSTSPTVGTILARMLFPSLVLLAAGLIVGTIRAGPASADAGLRYALGTSARRWMPGAAKFLSSCARVVAWGGVLLGYGACALIEITVQRRSFEAEILTARDWSLFAPLSGILLGRIVLGVLAEGARIRVGEATPPVFSRLQDLALLGLFVIPWYLYCLYTWTP